MPYDSNGIYNLPGGYQAVTGQTIQASQHNPPLEDIAAALGQVLLRSGLAPMTGNLPMGGFRITGMANGVADSDSATVEQAGVPIGTILDFAGSTAPRSFLLCYGQQVSRSEYAGLFSIIGTLYGAGNGSTTFNLPDLRGRVPAGRDDMGGAAANRLTWAGGVNGAAMGAAGGAQVHTLSLNEIPWHDHGGGTSSDGAHDHGYSVGNNASNSGEYVARSFSGSGLTTWRTSWVDAHRHTIGGQGGGQAHLNVQPTIILNKIIKAARA